MRQTSNLIPSTTLCRSQCRLRKAHKTSLKVVDVVCKCYECCERMLLLPSWKEKYNKSSFVVHKNTIQPTRHYSDCHAVTQPMCHAVTVWQRHGITIWYLGNVTRVEWTTVSLCHTLYTHVFDLRHWCAGALSECCAIPNLRATCEWQVKVTNLGVAR